MKTCQNCRYGDPATDAQGARFYWCRFLPPRPVIVSDETGQKDIYLVPPMKPTGRCAQFRLAFFRWLFRGVK